MADGTATPPKTGAPSGSTSGKKRMKMKKTK